MVKKKPLTKAKIVEALAENLEIKKTEAAGYLDELADMAAKEVKGSGEFTFPGVGKLVLAKRKARMGRNPQTGEAIKIPAKTVLKFRISKAMKDAVLPKK